MVETLFPPSYTGNSRTTRWRRKGSPPPKKPEAGQMVEVRPGICHRIIRRYYAWMYAGHRDEIDQVVSIFCSAYDLVDCKKLAREISRAMYQTARALGYRKTEGKWQKTK